VTIAMNRRGKSTAFQALREKERLTSKLVKKETTGGITTETYERPDGARWLFAYQNKNHVISSALSAVSSTSLA